MNLRDPVIYRILRAQRITHGDKWCIYPLPITRTRLRLSARGYAFSVRSNFEDHRPLYDCGESIWASQTAPNRVRAAGGHEYGHVKTLPEKAGRGGACPRLGRSGECRRLRDWKSRRAARSAPGFFAAKIGIVKANSECQLVSRSVIRDDLNENAERAMAVLAL